MNFIQAVTHPDFRNGIKWARVVGSHIKCAIRCDTSHQEIVTAIASDFISYGPDYPGFNPSEFLLEWELIEPTQQTDVKP